MIRNSPPNRTQSHQANLHQLYTCHRMFRLDVAAWDTFMSHQHLCYRVAPRWQAGSAPAIEVNHYGSCFPGTNPKLKKLQRDLELEKEKQKKQDEEMASNRTPEMWPTINTEFCPTISPEFWQHYPHPVNPMCFPMFCANPWTRVVFFC